MKTWKKWVLYFKSKHNINLVLENNCTCFFSVQHDEWKLERVTVFCCPQVLHNTNAPFPFFFEFKSASFDNILESRKQLNLSELTNYQHNPHIYIWNKCKISFSLQHPVVAVEQIAKFLGKDLTKELIVDIAEKCSFKNLASADEKFKQNATLSALDNPGEFGTDQMYRKGKRQGFIQTLDIFYCNTVWTLDLVHVFYHNSKVRSG